MNFCMFIYLENVIKEKKILIILILWATFMFFLEEHVTLFFRKCHVPNLTIKIDT